MYVSNKKGMHCCVPMAAIVPRTYYNVKLHLHCLYCQNIRKELKLLL